MKSLMANDKDFLMLSGLKHFRFCRRRWALVHLEQQWSENVLTLEGHYMHERVHDDGFTELRGSILLSRGMPIRSERLRITGVCDMVELHQDEHGISIHGRDGKWTIYPVEYKYGRPDERGADELQLCAQAMCLEEMLCCTISEGALYYGATKRRQSVAFSKELREMVRQFAAEMHQLYEKEYTPKVKPGKFCNACSLKELCLPKLWKKRSVQSYLRNTMEDVP